MTGRGGAGNGGSLKLSAERGIFLHDSWRNSGVKQRQRPGFCPISPCCPSAPVSQWDLDDFFFSGSLSFSSNIHFPKRSAPYSNDLLRSYLNCNEKCEADLPHLLNSILEGYRKPSVCDIFLENLNHSVLAFCMNKRLTNIQNQYNEMISRMTRCMKKPSHIFVVSLEITKLLLRMYICNWSPNCENNHSRF